MYINNLPVKHTLGKHIIITEVLPKAARSSLTLSYIPIFPMEEAQKEQALLIQLKR